MKLRTICSCLCVALIIMGGLNLTASQQIVKPPHKNKNAPTYRIGYKARFKDEKLLVQISVAPKYFNRQHMLALAQRLNKDFRSEQKLIVIVCDEYKAAKSPSLMDTLLIPPRSLALRGVYELERVSGKESIRFSTERDKPLDEVVADLSRTP